MKYGMLFIAAVAITIQLSARTLSQAPPGSGVKLLYYKDNGWLNASSWIQVNTSNGQIPIQRVPTDQDDIVFSKVMSGLNTVSFSIDSINVGGVTASQFECRSMHVSGITLFFSTNTMLDVGTYISIQTNNGGNLVIDSSAVFEHGLFMLHGGNTTVVDLGVYDASLMEYFSHATYSIVHGDDYSRINFVNSYFSGSGFDVGAHSHTYASNSTFNTYSFTFGDNSADTIIKCNIGSVSVGNIYNLDLSFGRNSSLISNADSIFAPFENPYLHFWVEA